MKVTRLNFQTAGKEFIATNELINNDGWLEAYSEGASEDFIYDLQNKWQLSLRKD
jgi:DNA topoisomerase IA